MIIPAFGYMINLRSRETTLWNIMNKNINPYTPGAGQMPVYLAGRRAQIDTAVRVFERLCSGLPTASIAFSGYRGVGKTVLLNHLQGVADEMGP